MTDETEYTFQITEEYKESLRIQRWLLSLEGIEHFKRKTDSKPTIGTSIHDASAPWGYSKTYLDIPKSPRYYIVVVSDGTFFFGENDPAEPWISDRVSPEKVFKYLPKETIKAIMFNYDKIKLPGHSL